MAYVTVDLDLDELETYELVNELVKRFKHIRSGKRLNDKEKELLRNEIMSLNMMLGSSNIGFEIKSLDDKIKLELVSENWQKISYAQLQNIIDK